jgi:hypothetical protein
LNWNTPNLSFKLAAAFAATLSALLAVPSASAQTAPAPAGTRPTAVLDHNPWDMGVLMQSGFGVTEDRSNFTFLMAGVHAGKVLTQTSGRGFLRGNFEYAVEVFPFWQSYTPRFQRALCVASTTSPGDSVCSAPYTVGGTYTGASITPIILRWNLVGTRRASFWLQGAGGLLWTNHKYPAYGGAPFTVQNDGPNADTSVWNFTPQGGVGVHYFVKPRRSIDIGANAIHISSASLGDRNPGVNASVQFTLGYSWWK